VLCLHYLFYTDGVNRKSPSSSDNEVDEGDDDNFAKANGFQPQHQTITAMGQRSKFCHRQQDGSPAYQAWGGS